MLLMLNRMLATPRESFGPGKAVAEAVGCVRDVPDPRPRRPRATARARFPMLTPANLEINTANSVWKGLLQRQHRIDILVLGLGHDVIPPVLLLVQSRPPRPLVALRLVAGTPRLRRAVKLVRTRL